MISSPAASRPCTPLPDSSPSLACSGSKGAADSVKVGWLVGWLGYLGLFSGENLFVVWERYNRAERVTNSSREIANETHLFLAVVVSCAAGPLDDVLIHSFGWAELLKCRKEVICAVLKVAKNTNRQHKTRDLPICRAAHTSATKSSFFPLSQLV